MNDSLPILLLVGMVDLFLLLLVTGLLWVTPQMTRPSIFFGVTVDPSLRKAPFAADCIRRFRRGVLQHTLLALMIVVGLTAALVLLLTDRVQASAMGMILGGVAGIFWQMIGATLAFVSVHKEVQTHAVKPTSVREASLIPRFSTSGSGRIFAVMILAPLLIVACCALYLWTRWDDIPSRFVTHWGLHGADAWTNKSVAGVFGPFLFALATYVPILLMPLLVRTGRRVHASGPGAVQESRFARYSLVILMLLGCFIVAAVSGTAVYLPLRASQDTPTAMIAIILIGNLLVDIGAMVALMRMGQGGSRLHVAPTEAPPAGEPVLGDRTDDRYWKWGLFYNNPNDPALWVEKRFGIGWTINMGRPGAWATIIALTAPGLILPVGIILIVSLASPGASGSGSPQRVVQGQKIPFETDPQLIGTWKSVDFVPQIEDFDPSQPHRRDSLVLKQIIVKPDGNGTTGGRNFVWTKGMIFEDNTAPPAHYEIHEIGGQTYLFFEWISGDVTIRGQKPKYYVLRKESSYTVSS